MQPSSTPSGRAFLRGAIRRALPGRAGLVWLGLALFLSVSPASLFSQQPVPDPPAATAAAPPDATATAAQPDDSRTPGTVSGTISVPTGALLGGARVSLLPDGQSSSQETITGDDGRFSFVGVLPGPFHLTVTADEFISQTVAGSLHPGESLEVPTIVLPLAGSVTRVVVLPLEEVAAMEIHEQEKQRALGVIPNFYVSYVHDAAPLTAKQKFELAWKSTIDPVNFAIVGAAAGIQQASNSFRGYGQGAQGYAKRYGAGFADSAIGEFLGGALFPSLFRQDPRYFYKGTGTKRARFFYAIASAFICKSDRGHWQANYSGILGSVATGGIANAYYPRSERGTDLLFEGVAVGLGASAVVNVLQEFVVRKFTPHLPRHVPNGS